MVEDESESDTAQVKVRRDNMERESFEGATLRSGRRFQ